MFAVINRSECRTIHAEYSREPVPFIHLFARGVKRIVEFRCRDMECVGINSDDRAILFVKIAYVEGVLTVQWVHVVVELVPGVSLDILYSGS